MRHARLRRPSMVGASPSSPPSFSAARETARGCAEGHPTHCKTFLLGDAHKQRVGMRRECREIDDAMDGRRTIRDALSGASTAIRASFSCGTNSVERSQTSRSNGGVAALSALRPRSWEHRDVVLRLDRQRPACRRVFVVASMARVVRCEEAGRAIAIVHLSKVGCAGEDVVAGS